MSVVAILLISSVFMIAAIVGLADALVHFVLWLVGRATEGEALEPAPAPVRRAA